MRAPALGIEVEPHCVGGPGVLDPSLLLHGLDASMPVLALCILSRQGAISVEAGLGLAIGSRAPEPCSMHHLAPPLPWDGGRVGTLALYLEIAGELNWLNRAGIIRLRNRVRASSLSSLLRHGRRSYRFY